MALDAKRIEQIIAAPDFTLASKAEYQGRRLKLYCKQTEKSKQDATSLIEWVARSEGGSVNWYNTGPTTIKIGSEVVIDKLPRPGLNWNFPTGRNTTDSGSFEIKHKSDGSIDALDVSITTAIYWKEWNLKTTDPIKWKLRKMDREFSKQPKVTLLTKSMDLIKYSWETSEECSAVTLYVNDEVVQPTATANTPYLGAATINTDKKTGTALFSALSPDTQYKLTMEFTRADTGLKTSINVTPKTYEHPCVKEISKAVIYPKSAEADRTQTVSVSNYSGEQVTVYMGLINNDTGANSVITSATTTSTTLGVTTVDLVPTAAQIYAKLINASSATVYYYCETTINGTVYKSQNTITGKINILGTEIPNVSSMAVQWKDSNTSVTAITTQNSFGTNRWMVQNLSNLVTKVTQTAQGVGSAAIKEYIFKLGKIEKVVAADDVTNELDWGKLNLTGDQKLVITVKDSRGMTSSVTKTITYYEYAKPFASISADRVNNYGTTVNLEYGYKYSLVNGKNALKLYYIDSYNNTTTYFIGDSSNYVAQSESNGTGTKTVYNITNDESVTFTIYIQDKFYSAIQAGTAKIERGQPIFFIDELNSGVGVNCFPKGEGLWATRIYLNSNTYITMENDAIVFRVEG